MIFRDTIIWQVVQFYHPSHLSIRLSKKLLETIWKTIYFTMILVLRSIVVTNQRVVQNPPLREEVLTFLRTYKTSESACRPSRLSHSTTVAGALPTTVTPDLDCQLTNLFTINRKFHSTKLNIFGYVSIKSLFSCFQLFL